MKHETKYFVPIVAALTAALVGLISLQAYLLLLSYEQKELAFDRSVMNALTGVVQQMEKEEAASKIFTVAAQLSAPPKGGKEFKRIIVKDDALPGGKPQTFSWSVTDSVKTKEGEMRVEVFHAAGIDTMTTVTVQGSSGVRSRGQAIGYSYSTDDKGIRIRASLSDSVKFLFRDTTKKRRGEIVSQVVDRLFMLERLPLEKRIDRTKLDSLIKSSLSAAGIGMPYTYRIETAPDDSAGPAERKPAGAVRDSAGYKTRLFPNDLISDRYNLVLFLRDRSSFIFNEMLLLFSLSVVFITIIAGSFVYSIRTIVRQRRLAGSIIEFINNMTHEFKTPISTIALAAEAIARPETLKSKPKLLQYNKVIADENVRMKKQVDTILQMAVLEEGEFELKRTPVDMHEVIRQAVKNLSLPVETRNGSVTVELGAVHPVVNGDAVHLSNIIHNVLDNANKYSPYAPQIAVATSDKDGRMAVAVRDNGIGIDKNHLHRVFDTYYRVPTGNTHDVKGFGLGLSYVKLIVEAHGGAVSISSEPGKGTTVEIVLPAVAGGETGMPEEHS